MRISSSEAAHLRSGDPREQWGEGFEIEGGSEPGPFGFLFTGGLAFDTMTGAWARAGIVSRIGEEGGWGISRR